MAKIKPEIVILIKGGVVCDIATSRPNLHYRLIDVDNLECGEYNACIEDYKLDTKNPHAKGRINVDIDKYTKEIVNY